MSYAATDQSRFKYEISNEQERKRERTGGKDRPICNNRAHVLLSGRWHQQSKKRSYDNQGGGGGGDGAESEFPATGINNPTVRATEENGAKTKKQKKKKEKTETSISFVQKPTEFPVTTKLQPQHKYNISLRIRIILC